MALEKIPTCLWASFPSRKWRRCWYFLILVDCLPCLSTKISVRMVLGCRVIVGRTLTLVRPCGHCCTPSFPPHQSLQPSRWAPLQRDDKNYVLPKTWSKDHEPAVSFWEVTASNRCFCCEMELLTSREIHFCFISPLLKYIGLLKMEIFFQCWAQGREMGPLVVMTRCSECESPYT